MTIRTSLTLALAIGLASCGGGETEPPKGPAGSGGGSTRAALITITPDQFFLAAERIYPQLFPRPANCDARAVDANGRDLVGAAKNSFLKTCTNRSNEPQEFLDLPYEGKVFRVRRYANGEYLGVASDGRAYGLGAYTGNSLTDFGTIQSYADLVCSRVTC